MRKEFHRRFAAHVFRHRVEWCGTLLALAYAYFLAKYGY